MVEVDRAVDLIDERIDVAIRARTALRTDAALITRTLSHSGRILMAAPGLAKKCKTKDLDALTALPTLASTDQTGTINRDFFDSNAQRRSVSHNPRMTCGDFGALRCIGRSWHCIAARACLQQGAGKRQPGPCVPGMAHRDRNRAHRVHDKARVAAGRACVYRASGRLA